MGPWHVVWIFFIRVDSKVPGVRTEFRAVLVQGERMSEGLGDVIVGGERQHPRIDSSNRGDRIPYSDEFDRYST